MNANDPTPSHADPDILRSDPAQRRKVLWLIAAMVATALLLFIVGLPALRRWMNDPSPAVMLLRMGTVYHGLSALLLATAGYAGWYAWRIFRTAQFPPPASWVLRDTRLLRGDHARARGWWVVACAVSLLLIAAYTMNQTQRLKGIVIPAPLHPHAASIANPHG